ncbi:thioredoxin-disulfide reductase [Candidatus Tremblaya phenacola]|uniref:Thioredoxin reductase n=1 Tax=Candidatus Tremblayella phenacoccinincola TaxID=1010676 RepID=A0A2G0V782_9PROT|nr:thioredoxin-disulfide reductase [Candidatus Tremblaya phenacola]PHN16330.1 Thioredoxin reductase [Candidatus Tremblaya phenacola]
MHIKYYKLVILGTGPSGYTAAIYAARANLNPILITGNSIGGQLINTNNIGNWPGESEGLTGQLLMERMHSHALKLNVKMIFDNIIKTNLLEKPFYLLGNEGYYCDSLIIATGSSPKYLNIESEEAYKGKGVSTCAICDGYFYHNKTVAVIGGGNSALEEGLFLSDIANKTHLIHRRNYFKAEEITIKKVLLKVLSKAIILHLNHITEELLGNKLYVTNIVLKSIINKTLKRISVNGVFIAIGNSPNTSAFKEQLLLDKGYIKVKAGFNNSTATSILGVFASGDVVDSYYRQAITSAGSGCMAALDTKTYLNNICIYS